MNKFKVISEFTPKGDQPAAIKKLKNGIDSNIDFQTLMGITGSGKSATIAWLIEEVQKPTLVLAPNKALAAQLANEFKQFFPENRVEYFVSYYDYYQPEAYVPRTDTFIEKDANINEEIDRLRHSATSALLLRDDVIVVSSVSCIYGLGSPKEYKNKIIPIIQGKEFDLDDLIGIKVLFSCFMGYDLERKEIIFMTREGQKIMMVQDNFTGTLVGECGLPVISSENETRCAATIIARLLFHKDGPIMKGLEIVEVRKK